MRRDLRALFCLAILALHTLPAFGAFTATTQWDVRTTGSDSNGGGFDTSATGSDKSQGSATAFTDLVIGGTTTQGTSATLAFDATSPGNILNVTSGAGCTVQRVQVVSRSGGTATFDKSLGTAASTCSGTAYGPLLTISKADSLVVAGNTIHIKAGTYTLTTQITMASVNHIFMGYNSTHADGGTKPLITTATNSTVLFTAPGNGSRYVFVNMSFSNTAGTRSDAIRATTNFPDVYILNSLFDGFDKAVNGDGSSGTFAACHMVGSEIKNSVTAGIACTFDVNVTSSWIHDNTKDGIMVLGNNQAATVVATVVSNNGRYGVFGNSAAPYVIAVNSVFYKNGLTFTGHPFSQIHLATADGVTATNCIFYGGAASNFDTSSGGFIIGRNNALDSQVMGGNFYVTTGDASLSSDPFTNAASGDFSLNNTAGGGGSLRAAGFPGVGPAGTGFLDIGAIQSGTGSTPSVCPKHAFACAH